MAAFKKSRVRRSVGFAVLLLCLLSFSVMASNAVCGDQTAPPGQTELPNQPCPIEEYILVSMTHEYSFPVGNYDPAYFGAEYVERVEAIDTWENGALADKERFCLVERLFLTDAGKANIDALLNTLNAREDILAAERDYLSPGVSADPVTETPAFAEDPARYGDTGAEGYPPDLGADGVRCEGWMNGDVDRDWILTAADARLALRASVGLWTPFIWEQFNAADVNGDLHITAEDARAILRLAVGAGNPDAPPSWN